MARILSGLTPNLFFDDQRGHRHSSVGTAQMLHATFAVLSQSNAPAEYTVKFFLLGAVSSS
ncbi:hypothetical protein P3T17_002421 [Paraburkholderia sp. GAS82]